MSGLDARGGGVFIGGGTAWITNSEITSNTAQGGVGFKGRDAFGGGIEGGGDGGDGGNGGNGLGGGLCVAGGSVTMHGVSVTGNAAKGGEGGKGGDPYPRGFKRGRNGDPGSGLGGGLFVAAGAGVSLDPFSLSNTKRNHASTTDDDISGL